MKKNTVFILTLILLLALSTLGFADTVQIGTGTATTSYLPIYGFYGYNYTQQIYLQTQINKSGNITKLRFFYVSGAITNSKDWVIYMGHTTKTSFSSTTDWVPLANLTQVFAGDVSSYLPAANNWMEIPLTTPFNYNNTDNLVIAVDENTSGYASMSWGAFTSGANTGIYYYNDSTNPDPASPPAAYSRTGTINRIQLVFPNTSAPLAPTLLYPANGAWAFTNEVLSWAPTMGAGDTNAYDVYFGTSSNPPLVSSNQTATTYTPNLAAGTTYYWKVVAKNEIGSTASDIWSFKTPTTSQLAESFENTTFPPAGWANPGTWSRSTTYAKHGTASAYKYGSTTTQSILSTPKVTITSTSTLDFWALCSLTTGTLQIVYSPDRTTWTQVGSNITFAATNTWYHNVINLSSLAGNNYYLGFRTGLQYASFYVDAVFGPEITQAPPDPAVLVYPADGGWAFLDDTLSWTSGEGIVNGYKLYISDDDIVNNDDFITNQTGTTYKLSDLEDLVIEYGHTYYWKVVPYNNNGDAEDCPVWSFKTPTATQLAESFENTTFPPIGWKRTTPSTSYWTRSTYYSTHGSACMYAYTSTSTVYDISTPKCTITSGSTLNFSTRATSTSQKLQILYSTDRINWTQIGADITYSAANVWYNKSIDLSAYAGEKYLVFRSPTHTTTGSIYVDAVFGPEITQAPPDPAVLVYPTNGGWAFLDDTLSWTSGEGIVNGYKLYISDDDIVNNDDFITNQTGTTYKLSDLEDLVIEYGHTYYWKVVPYNNNGDAEGCPVWSFKTPTATQLAESFTGTTFPPTGWTSPATSWIRDTSTYYSAPASAKCGYTSGTTWWLVTPKLSPTEENHILSFMYRDYSSTSSYDYIDEYTYVLVSTTTDFTGADVIWEGDYEDFTTEWQQANLDLSAYIGNDIYIAFKHVATGGNYRYIDNVFGPEITPEAPEAPTLVSPADEAVNVSITPTFSWTAATTGGVPDGFKIYCGNPIDYDNPIATVSKTTTSYTIPGTNALAYNTTYQWTVSAYKEGFEDARAAERSFTTMEDPTIYDFPYTAGDFETGALPINWTVSEGSPGSSYHWQAKTGSTGHGITQAHSGTYYGWLNCYFAQTTYNPYYLITAPIDLSATDNPKRLNYWYWIGTNSFPATADNPLCVDISTDNQESWTTIYSHSKTENLSNWYQNIVDLTDYNDDIVYLRFRAYSSYGSGQTDMGLDDIIIEAIPTGPVLECTPTSLDFGEVAFGVQVGPKKVTVTNTGIGVLELNQDNTQIIGTGFTIDDFDFSLEANESGQINVYANAAEEGPFTATLRITYGTQQCDVALSATGLPEGIIVIGTGDEDLGLPIKPNYGYSYSQSIFLQSDIHLANRNIEKIYYYWNGAGAASSSNEWTVYMGNTDKNEFVDEDDWIPIGNLTQVFSGVVDLPAVEGWVEINLASPFYHNNQNIVIAVDENESGYDSYNDYFYGTSVETKGNRSILYRNDSTNPDPASPPTGTYYNYAITGYPNIKLEFEEAQPPLPVELTTFTAVISSDNLVEISWVTQTETGMVGYYVYRSSSESLDNAIAVSDMIEALNTPEQHTYKFIDSEIYDSGNYYYWLQTVDLAGSVSFHGPVSVYYTSAEDNPIPEIPKVTELRSIYPNPFNPVAFIPYSLAEESDAHFYIYNVKGQLLRHIYVGPQYPGYYQIRWDGKDINGKSCGSGVYYIIMKAGKQTFQRKAVLMK